MGKEFPEAIIQGMFETNSGFRVGQRASAGVKFPFLGSFLLVWAFILAGGMGAGLSFCGI